MPQLQNERNELYAKHRANGMIPSKAAICAGYASGSGIYTKLEADPEVAARISELMVENKEKKEQMRLAARQAAETVGTMTGVGRAWVIRQLAENAILARQEGEYGESNAALIKIGEEFGMFNGKGNNTDDKENSIPTSVDLDVLNALADSAKESINPSKPPEELDSTRAMRLIEGHIPRKKPSNMSTGSETDVVFTPDVSPDDETQTTEPHKRNRY